MEISLFAFEGFFEKDNGGHNHFDINNYFLRSVVTSLLNKASLLTTKEIVFSFNVTFYHIVLLQVTYATKI